MCLVKFFFLKTSRKSEEINCERIEIRETIIIYINIEAL